MILDRLREATHHDHKQLESHVDLLNRSWSLPFYQQLLERFYGFYAVVEPSIFAHQCWKAQNFDVEKRQKIRLLEQDLTYLGLSEAEIGALPRDAQAPQARSFAQSLGSAYVFEGATLGGQIITRHLRKELGIDEGRGCSFFYSYGREVGPMWQEFVALLNSYPANEAEQSALVKSACDTFCRFDAWLAPVL